MYTHTTHEDEDGHARIPNVNVTVPERVRKNSGDIGVEVRGGGAVGFDVGGTGESGMASEGMSDVRVLHVAAYPHALPLAPLPVPSPLVPPSSPILPPTSVPPSSTAGVRVSSVNLGGSRNRDTPTTRDCLVTDRRVADVSRQGTMDGDAETSADTSISPCCSAVGLLAATNDFSTITSAYSASARYGKKAEGERREYTSTWATVAPTANGPEGGAAITSE